jgi:hypothetical protein
MIKNLKASLVNNCIRIYYAGVHEYLPKQYFFLINDQIH